MGQKAKLHFNLRNSWVLLLGIILALAVFVTRWAPWQARVLSVSPQKNADAAATVHITIQFKQPMETDSVAAHFSVTPATAGKAVWDGNTFAWMPEKPLNEGIYTAHLSAGSLAVDGRSIRQDIQWTFRVRTGEVVFLSPGAEGGNEIWAIDLEGGEPRQVTNSSGMVVNDAPAPDGERILYAQQNEQNGSDLWWVRRDGSSAEKLVDCGKDRCSSPAWSPDGKQAAFSRESAGEAGAFDAPRLWILDLNTKDARAYFPTDIPKEGAEPSWSPDGRYIAVLDASIGGIRIIDLEGGDDALLETTLERMGHWSPDGKRLVFASEEVVEGYYGTRLMVMDLEKRKVETFLPGEFEQADDSTPFFSPDGSKVAVSRRVPGGPIVKQIWVMGADGSDKVKLTADETITYTVMGWDAFGKRVLFQRAQLGSSDVKPDVGFIDVETGEVHVLGVNASQPAWLY